MVNEKKIDAVKREISPLKLADIIVLTALIILSVVLLVTVYGKTGEKVIVTYYGVSEEYDLGQDREIAIEDKLTVCISGGAVYVKDAQCPDKICQNSGAVKKVNETIVCAPFGITVRITDGKGGGNKVVTG